MTVIETRPFTDWMASVKDLKTGARIAERLRRVAISGSFGDSKDIGDGVGELRFHFGPGYRVYFCRRAGAMSLFCSATASNNGSPAAAVVAPSINARTARSPRMLQAYHAFVKCTRNK